VNQDKTISAHQKNYTESLTTIDAQAIIKTITKKIAFLLASIHGLSGT
jgi:hypothetical protein